MDIGGPEEHAIFNSAVVKQQEASQHGVVYRQFS